jgi:hypothetical protein
MSFPPIQWFTLAAWEMTTWQSNCGRQTSVRVCRRSTSSSQAKRRVHVPSSSRGTIGKAIIIEFVASNLIDNISSLVTTLRAAELFEQSHLSSPAVAPLVDAAKVFYVEGFFLTHGTSVVLELSQKASAASKTFALNFSAPFIPQFFGTQLQSILPYCDIIIGNETEAEAYAAANGLPDTKDLAAIAKAVAISPKSNKSRPRVVIFTHGAESTTLVSSAEPDSPKVFKVNPIDDKLIVDTNGAGDAFAGGFLGAYVAGKSLDECVEVGHKMGAMCVQLVSQCFFDIRTLADYESIRLVPNSCGPRSPFFKHVKLSYTLLEFPTYITLSTAQLLYPYTYRCLSSFAFHKHVAIDISNL